MSGLALTDAERTFFREADPWGYIVFSRNIADKAQLLRLTDEAARGVRAGRTCPSSSTRKAAASPARKARSGVTRRRAAAFADIYALARRGDRPEAAFSTAA